MCSLLYFYICMPSWNDHDPDQDREHFINQKIYLGLFPVTILPLEVTIICLTSITKEK